MISRGKTAQLRAAAGDGEQDIGHAGFLQSFKARADLIRRAVERVLLGAAGLVGIGEHMRAAFGRGLARHIDGALGIDGLALERGLFVGLVVGDIKLARHRHLHRIEAKSLRLALGFVEADALGDLLARWHIDRGSD